MDLRWTVDEIEGASLVRCRVYNDDAVRRRVRIESRFDAPVLPPRRAGVPEPGWDATGVTLRLDPDERRGVGFAVPAPPVEPPVQVVDVGDAGDGESAFGTASAGRAESGGSAATDALRVLADHRPPREAVEGGERGADGGAIDDDASAATDDGSEGDEDETPSQSAIDDWLVAVESRIVRTERLTDADVGTATELVAEAGGVAALAEVDERVAADAERLRAVSERASALAERAEATDAPIGALERLA